jgi:hypothetical protein
MGLGHGAYDLDPNVLEIMPGVMKKAGGARRV